MFFSLLQPVLEEGFNEMLELYDDIHPTTHILTHMLVGGLLSPLEMARTRYVRD
jgi:hypothetical protein